MGRARFAATAAAVVVFIGLGATTADATFHEWKISEVYSNATGTVQFIEFLQPSFSFDDERFVGGQTLTDAAFGHTFTFGSSLPNQPPPSSHFLVATPGYAALSGVPAPDYMLATNNFFSTAGDTLTFATFVDQLQFTGAQFPTNGTNSLNRRPRGFHRAEWDNPLGPSSGATRPRHCSRRNVTTAELKVFMPAELTGRATAES